MYDLATGDLNGDGWPDFVGADLATHLTVFLNDTHGSFSASSIPTPGTRLWSVAIADFTSDSVPDIVAADESGLFLFVGNGSGGFAPAVSVHGGRYQWVASTDLNGDGHADLVTGLTYMGGVTLWSWIGTGTGQFAPPQIVFTSIAFANWPKLTDLNADGKPDLALPGPSGVWVLLADGSGGFGPAVLHLAGGYDTTDIAIGDFNNDVNGDLVAATSQ
jgi:hypothetical protein